MVVPVRVTQLPGDVLQVQWYTNVWQDPVNGRREALTVAAPGALVLAVGAPVITNPLDGDRYFLLCLLDDGSLGWIACRRMHPPTHEVDP